MRKTAGVFVLVFFVAGVAALAATKTLNVRQPDASMGTGFLVFKIGELKNCVLDCRNDLSQMAAKGYQGPVKIQITDSSGRRIVADLGRIDNIESPSRINWNHRTAGGDSLLVKINDAGFLSVAQRYFEQNQFLQYKQRSA